MNILEIEKLTKNYKKFSLDNISFPLPEGAIMGLIGEKGAGKTTIINLITGAVKKSGGKTVDRIKKSHAYETALQLKEEGKIRHFGISFHDRA